jgi:hypothetical protein
LNLDGEATGKMSALAAMAAAVGPVLLLAVIVIEGVYGCEN